MAITRAQRGLLALMLLAVALLTGCGTNPSAPTSLAAMPAPLPAGFVRRDGSGFTIGGKPFKFVGFNLYDAAASAFYSCRPQSQLSSQQLDAAFAEMHNEAGATVVRFWAYATYTRSGADWSGIDRVLAEARKYGMRVIPVLDDGPGNCTFAPPRSDKRGYQADTWYSTGYRVACCDAPLSYLSYLSLIIPHYRNDPTIMAWMMMNEAETRQRDAAGRSEIVDFAADVGPRIKAMDSNHLVTVGTQSNGAPGVSGTDVVGIYSIPSVDFVEVHDWGNFGSDTTPLPGGVNGVTIPDPHSPACDKPGGKIGCSFAWAKALGKPLIVGEVGISAETPDERVRRATLLQAKMHADAQAGASGYLVWQWNTVNTDTYGVLGDDADPLLGVMKAEASGEYEG